MANIAINEPSILEKIESMKPIINGIDTKIEQANIARDTYYASINQKFDSINTAIQQILSNPNFKNKQAEIQRLSQQIRELNNIIAKNREEIQGLNAAIKGLQDEITRLQGENRNLRKEFEEKIAELTKQKQGLEEENARLNTEIQTLKNEKIEISAALDGIIQLLNTKLLALDSLSSVANSDIDQKIKLVSDGVNGILREINSDSGSPPAPAPVPAPATASASSRTQIDDPDITIISIKDQKIGDMELTKNKILNDLQTKIRKLNKILPRNENVIFNYTSLLDKIKGETTVEGIQQLMKLQYKNGEIMGGKRQTKKIYRYSNRHMKTRKHKLVGRKLVGSKLVGSKLVGSKLVGSKLVGGWAYESTKKIDDKSKIITTSSSDKTSSSNKSTSSDKSSSSDKSKSSNKSNSKFKKVKAKGMKTKNKKHYKGSK
jgi:predicted  nucleic acid-binding Zn-ribbon protein